MSANSAWPTVKLGDLGRFASGGTPNRKREEFYQGETPWISSADISEDGKITARRFITDEAIAKSATTEVPAGTLLVAVRIGVGKTALTTSPTCFSQDVVALLDTDPNEVSTGFLQHLITWLRPHLEQIARGVTIKGITIGDLKDLNIPLPPLAEQRRIAKILDQSYSQLHDSRQLLSSLDSGRSELLAALLKQEDYPTAVLGEVAKINPRLSRTPDDSATVTFLPMAEVHENGSIGTGERREYREVKRGYTKFENEDILVAKITPCFQNKKIAQATIPTDFGVGSTEFHVVRPGENTDARYLTDLLRQDKLVLEGEKFMTGSGGQRRVPPWFFQEMSIPFPPIEEQQHIGELLGTVVDLQTMVSQKITALEELHASLSARAFAGKL